MISSRTFLKNLRYLDQYLNQFNRVHRSMYFEKFIAEVFSRVLYLPFYAINNEDVNKLHRVTWQGNLSPISKAPLNSPDVISYCCNFYLLIEATLKPGANQWSQEFAQSIRHCEDFINATAVQPNDIYVILVTPHLHGDSYRSIHHCPRQECNIIPIEIPALAKILETSIFAFSMKHLELRKLFNQISDSVRTSSSLNDFRNIEDDKLNNWQKEVLKEEKSAVVGVKCYEAMKKINRTHIGSTEILRKLHKHPIVNKYLKIIGDKLSIPLIEDSLVQQCLVSRLPPTYEGEKLFSPVPFRDFKERGLRMIKVLEKING